MFISMFIKAYNVQIIKLWIPDSDGAKKIKGRMEQLHRAPPHTDIRVLTCIMWSISLTQLVMPLLREFVLFLQGHIHTYV